MIDNKDKLYIVTCKDCKHPFTRLEPIQLDLKCPKCLSSNLDKIPAYIKANTVQNTWCMNNVECSHCPEEK